MISQNQTQVATALQVFHNLGSLQTIVDKVIGQCQENLRENIDAALDVQVLVQQQAHANRGSHLVCYDDVMMTFNDIMTTFSDMMMIFDDIMMIFGDIMMTLSNIMMTFSNIMMTFSDIMLNLVIL